MADAVPFQFSTANIAHLYPLPEIEGWQLLEQHFDLVQGFSFIVVTAPDEWGIALMREHLPEILPEPGAIARVCFDPDADFHSLAEKLLAMPTPSAQVRVVWIDSEPGLPESLAQRVAAGIQSERRTRLRCERPQPLAPSSMKLIF